TERDDRVVGQEDDEEQREIEEIAMDVLENERKGALTPVRLPRLSHGTRRRILPERLVVGAAIVVAGEAEPARGPENQQRGREWERRGPPAGLRTEPGVRSVAEEERRVHRR